MKKLWREPFFKVASTVLAVVVVLGLVGPLFAPHDPHAFIFESLAAPSAAHLLGVNDGGMDIFSEWLYALRNTLWFGFLVMTVSLVLGAGVGVWSGMMGGWIDRVSMRVLDVLIALPSVIVLLLVASIYRPNSLELGVLLGVLSFPVGAKVLRFQTLHVTKSGYVASARQMGAGTWYLAWRHVVPGLYALLCFSAASRFRFAVSAQATLAFLGLLDPTEKSFGMMIRQSMRFYYLEVWWHWILPPAAMLAVILVAVSLVLFSFEGVLDPRLKGVLRG